MWYKAGVGEYQNELPPVPETIVDECPEIQEIKITNISEVHINTNTLYSIEVENNHNYFANGILTKNSGFLNWITWTELLPTINSWEDGYQVYVCGTPSGEREDNVLYFTDQVSSQYNKYRVTALENPRYTKENYQRDIEQYGGEDSDDFKRLVLGEHASPVVRIFSRDSIHTSTHEFFSGTISSRDLEEDPDKVRRLLSSLPTTKDKVAAGIDLGYSDPTIISIFRFHDNHWINFVRITLERIEYPQQINFIDKLDTIYDFLF